MKITDYIIITFCILNSIIAKDLKYNNQENNKFNIIELNNYYDGKGAIIPKSYRSIFQHVNDSLRFAPTVDEIVIAERIFHKLIIEQFKRDSLLKNLNIKKLRKCYRQYFGYINEDNNKIVIIVLLNFDAKDAGQIFHRWDNSFFYSTSDFYAKNVRFIEINIRNERYEGTFTYSNWP